MRSFLILLSGVLSVLPASTGHTAASLPGREVRYLSGTDNEHTVNWEFFCTGGRRSGTWTSIEMPSCWEQQGFGSYNYGRDYVTYGRKFRFADEKGMYRHAFTVPASWSGRKVNIVFEGSMTDTEVKINGRPAGEIHQGSFYRFSYDISGLLKYGEENLLEVTVSKMSTDNSVNRAERYADYWIFGGIFRPVYLEAFPVQHISGVAVWGLADGSFHALVDVSGAEPGMQIEAVILDASGGTAGSCTADIGGGSEQAGPGARQEGPAAGPEAPGSRPQEHGISQVGLSTGLKDPLLWTAESPNLYTARFSLKMGNEILYSTDEKFGFRTLEIRHGDGIYLNGVKIKMKGINRHAFWPETGRTLNRGIDLMDITLMKEMNMNAVRCSHYPPDRSFLELCDSLGLYVLDELAGWQNAYSTETGEKLVREMVLRDRNHPSVIFWSNGNEGGTNKELDDDFTMHDPSGRKVIHCHHRPGNDFNGIETNHYESYQSTEHILQDTLIYMTSEFLHAQNDGGGGAGLRDYWELMYASPMSGGGFIWALLDEGVVRTDRGMAIDVNLVNAPDGVLGPHREKEGSFYAIREIFSPVIIGLDELPGDFDGGLPIENRYFFTSLDRCNFRWELVEFPAPSEDLSGHRILRTGMQEGPSVAPGMKGKIQLQLPGDWKASGALRLTAIDPHGKEVMEWTWRTGDPLAWLPACLEPEEPPEVEATETDSLISLLSNDIFISISKITGELAAVRNNRNRLTSFGGGPQLCSGSSSLKNIRHFRDGKKYTVEITYSGDLGQVRWTMHPGGWVEMQYTYSLAGLYDFAGISFDFEEGNVISARWLGEGPYRVWKNRMTGGTIDVWEKEYNNTMAGMYPWNFPEFKGYYADVSWMELNTLDGKILVACPDKDLFVRLFEFYAFPEPTLSPDLPPGDISFMDAISPVGTKMSTRLNASARSTGPQGEPNQLDGTFTHTLYFNFGILP